jgi:hypothetical protein
MQSGSGTDADLIPTTPIMRRKNIGSRCGAIGLACSILLGLSVSVAGGQEASAAVPQQRPTHTVWRGGEATVTGPIAPGTRLRVHAVLNQACQIGNFTKATCQPQSLLGWETITEDGTFSPVPAPVAPYGVCRGDTDVVVNGHTRVIAGQLFQCFTLQTAMVVPLMNTGP